MATTIASFSAIDDTAIDAESPIVESMVKQMRDNSYWIDAGTRKTTQTSQTKVLVPDGTGGIQWVEGATVLGAVTHGLDSPSVSTTWVTITGGTNGLLRIDVEYSFSTNESNIRAWVDLSNDSFGSICRDQAYPPSTVYSGTITTGSTIGTIAATTLTLRRSGGNIQYSVAAGLISTGFSLLWGVP